ncbi:uncharacterized protein J3R85_015789 [Psidium guajava]|nr:uncharacterized protein J3R85_015789 [Psidium guajava]
MHVTRADCSVFLIQCGVSNNLGSWVLSYSYNLEVVFVDVNTVNERCKGQ